MLSMKISVSCNKNTFHATKYQLHRICKKNQTIQCDLQEIHHFMCKRRHGKHKELQKIIRGVLVMENYKKVHNVHSQCSKIQIPWIKPYDNNTSCISTATPEKQPSNAFHAVNVQQSHLRCIYIGQPHDFSCKTKTENSDCVSTGSVSKHLDFTMVGKVCLHWSIYLNNTMF
jgi:hypothetical protein